MLELTASDPRRVGPFRIVGRLGAGGMGLIYAGQDSTGRRAAIKVVQPQLANDAGFRARFAREAVLLGRVDGACTARVLAADVDADPPYLALEYVDGPTLAEHIEANGPMSEALLTPLAIGLAEALVAIHAVGVVHRDLKPANVVLSATGPKVIDFGVAYLADATSLTTSGLVLGSPGWMAPEQFADDEVSPASDVFAWASTVYFAATGRAPFGGGSVEAVYYRIGNVEPDLTSVPEPLRTALTEAFAKTAAGRPTPRELVEELSGVPAADVANQTTMLLRTAWTFRPTAASWDPLAEVSVAVATEATIAEAKSGTAALTTFAPAAAPATVPVQPRRRRGMLVAAGLVAVLAAAGGVYAVTRGGGPPALAGDGSSPTPSASTSPSASPTASAASPTNPVTAAVPAPPFYASNPICSGVTCTLLGAVSGIHTSRGVLRAEVIGQPIPDASTDETLRPVYISLYDTSGSLVYTTPEAIIGAYDKATPEYPGGGILTDKAGRIFVPFAVGAHGGLLIVLDPNQNPVNDFDTVPLENGAGGRFSSDSAGGTGVDLNGDGINEIAVDVNDYKPDYARGTTWERYYQFQSGDFALIGCRKIRGAKDFNAGPTVAAGGPGCEAG